MQPASPDRDFMFMTIAGAAGFHELHVDARVLAEMGKGPLRVESGLLREDCARLFAEWRKAGLCGTY